MQVGRDPAEDNEYDSDDDTRDARGGQQVPEFDMPSLEMFCEKIEPLIRLHLETNLQQKAFDNYEVIWEEEFGEINDLYQLETDFDFIQANKAVTRTVNQTKDTDTAASTTGPATQSGFDDWDDGPSRSSAAGRDSAS